jgi:malonate decarboxylase delta subunit
MEKMSYTYPAGASASGRALAGVVGSGDLEVLLEPAIEGASTVAICTSVDGMAAVWQALLERIFVADADADADAYAYAADTEPLPAVHLEINDFGATPGVVRLRIAQAFEQLKQGGAP